MKQTKPHTITEIQDKFIDNIHSFMPSLSKANISLVFSSVSDIMSDTKFFSFLEGKGDYPNLGFVLSEEELKRNIHLGFKKEYVKHAEFARYEIIDKIIERENEDHEKVSDLFYSFLKIIAHLGWKLLLRIVSMPDLKKMSHFFITNLDYMFIDCSSDNTWFRDTMSPLNYFNSETNTIGYNKNIDISLFKIVLKQEEIEGLFNIFTDIEVLMEDKFNIQYLFVLYICTLMYMSRESIAMCHHCREIYINHSEKNTDKCRECTGNEKKENQLLYFNTFVSATN